MVSNLRSLTVIGYVLPLAEDAYVLYKSTTHTICSYLWSMKRDIPDQITLNTPFLAMLGDVVD